MTCMVNVFIRAFTNNKLNQTRFGPLRILFSDILYPDSFLFLIFVRYLRKTYIKDVLIMYG